MNPDGSPIDVTSDEPVLFIRDEIPFALMGKISLLHSPSFILIKKIEKGAVYEHLRGSFSTQ